jgi:hypothetical protein
VHYWHSQSHKANFINGFYGVETPNEASLLETDKRQNLRGERSLVEKLRFIERIVQFFARALPGMLYQNGKEYHKTHSARGNHD